jgi:hypothetical protein
MPKPFSGLQPLPILFPYVYPESETSSGCTKKSAPENIPWKHKSIVPQIKNTGKISPLLIIGASSLNDEDKALTPLQIRLCQEV